MKKKTAVVMLLITCFLFAPVFVSAVEDDLTAYPECPYCGMDRQKFAHSRMLIEFDDDSEGFCSLHCAVIGLALQLDNAPKAIKVGDYNAHKLIDAEKAHWVIGGNKVGVMTKRAKWAFEKKEDADKFVKESGGKVSTFEETIKAAYEDIYADTKMIRERRKARKTEQAPPLKK
jgi:nitrous oxide reductase accessory protein NosL